MFGYACNETPELMPAPIFYAHKILRLISEARHSGEEKVLGPDAKSQVTVQYENGKPVGVREIVVSHQHLVEDMTSSRSASVSSPMCARRCPKAGSTARPSGTSIRPASSYIGGPDGDSGLTGRKIIVDTYGGAAPHGGGAFSGKDPTKVDRSAAYAARYLAKNVVAAGLADRCTIQLAYAIGVARPLSIYVDTHGTGKVSEDKLEKVVAEVDGSDAARHPQASRPQQPIYARTSSYGHFGRTPDKEGGFSWEKTDLADDVEARGLIPAFRRHPLPVRRGAREQAVS